MSRCSALDRSAGCEDDRRRVLLACGVLGVVAASLVQRVRHRARSIGARRRRSWRRACRIGFVQLKADRRLRKFEEQFPEAIDLIARALRAGHALHDRAEMVAEEIPDPVGREFRLLYDQQNFGMPLPDALKRFAERVPLSTPASS